MKNNKKIERITYIFVLISFLVPIGYLIFKIVMTNRADVTGANYRSVADYVLMLLQCVLGVIVIHIPSLLSKKFKIQIPSALYIMYIIFLYCAIFLGEVRNFYYLFPHWDVILHAFSSLMSGTFGFILIDILNKDKHVFINLSPKFVALFAFCFSVTIGSVWEIYEFVFDGLLGLNMQKFILADGTVLVGHAALVDTMKDIIVDCCGAFVAALLGHYTIVHKIHKKNTKD